METLKSGRKSGVSPIDLKSYTVVMGPIRNTKSAWELTIIFRPTLLDMRMTYAIETKRNFFYDT